MVFKINGGRSLSGAVEIESAKNSVLPLLAAALLTKKETVIENCPLISDVVNMAEILRAVGAKVNFDGKTAVINAENIISCEFSEELASRVRTSVLLLGALCGSVGKAKIPYPGGCDIGGRPIDIHISALKGLGAKIREYDGFIICDAPVCGGKTVLRFPSVGATENAIIAAAKASGESMICNAAREPEIEDLAKFLNLLGAKIRGAGTSVVRVEGVKELGGGAFRPSFDRIEAGTYLIAAAITGGEAEIRGVNAENISTLVGKLCDNTCKITLKNDIIYLHSGRTRKSFSVTTGPYPMFPTDLQAEICALCAVSDGVSVIKEKVFGKRFHHVAELKKMGADMTLKGNVLTIRGVPVLCGAEVCAHDLRCGAALVLAGLNAEGTTIVRDVQHLDRGYCRMEEKLSALGADVVRVPRG
ncbi:MAG: UDP-N-acetylglucosamine 1-carboxyvinyltransferase [Clostridia bacterium]|nr:UDP-N-acetylglucosamine 1-carboxyvinyltransferase [Clostridia bacterium]